MHHFRDGIACYKLFSYGVQWCIKHPEPNASSRRGQIEFLNHKVDHQMPIEPYVVLCH